MRILQTSDNHLDQVAYSKVDAETGLNVRGIDYLNAFRNICKTALNEQVDVFVIAGDLFTNSNPHQYYVLEVTRLLKRLSKAGIMTLIVGGNREIPNTVSGLNPLTILSEIDNVFVATEPSTFILGSYDFVCVPAPTKFHNMYNIFPALLDTALEKSTSDKKILVTHVPFEGSQHSSEELIEPFDGEYVKKIQIPNIFSYIILGHMHKFQQIESILPMFYSGSSERFNFEEENDDKYTLLVELEQGIKVKPIRLPIRKMITLIDFDCSGSSGSKIEKFVLDSIDIRAKELKDALVGIKLQNIDIQENSTINWEPIIERLEECDILDYKIQTRTSVSLPESNKLNEHYILPPVKELELYVKDKRKYTNNAQTLMKVGNEIIKRV